MVLCYQREFLTTFPFFSRSPKDDVLALVVRGSQVYSASADGVVKVPDGVIMHEVFFLGNPQTMLSILQCMDKGITLVICLHLSIYFPLAMASKL